MSMWKTNKRTGGHFRIGPSLKPYLASKEWVKKATRNVEDGVPDSFIHVNGLPRQTEADLDWEAMHKAKVFFVDAGTLFTIQPYVSDKHVKSVIDEGVGQYRIPTVRKYGNNFFIQDGNHRAEALIRLGYTKIPVMIAGNDTSPTHQPNKEDVLIRHWIDQGS